MGSSPELCGREPVSPRGRWSATVCRGAGTDPGRQRALVTYRSCVAEVTLLFLISAS